MHAEIRTRVVVICGPTRYQLDHGGVLALRLGGLRTSDNYLKTEINLDRVSLGSNVGVHVSADVHASLALSIRQNFVVLNHDQVYL